MNTLLVGMALVTALNAPFAGAPEPVVPEPEPITMTVVASAYSPRPEETDSTPFITASGTRTRDGIIAANFLPFGTKVRFPDAFGDKVFTVEDRMNRRYTNAYPHRIDMAFEKTKDAIRFGRQAITLEIVEIGSAATRAKTAEDISLRLRELPAS